MPVSFLEGIEHFDDVGVVELAQSLSFAGEALNHSRVVNNNFRLEELDGNDLAGMRILTAIDCAHPAGADQVIQFVAAANYRRWRLTGCHISIIPLVNAAYFMAL